MLMVQPGIPCLLLKNKRINLGSFYAFFISPTTSSNTKSTFLVDELASLSAAILEKIQSKLNESVQLSESKSSPSSLLGEIKKI